MRKIAICLSGAMSKLGKQFHTQNSLYDPAQYINFNICYNSIKKHIINVNNYEFDFFIHSWNEDLKEKINILYNPKSSLFENNKLYNNEINLKIKHPTYFAAVSKSLSMQKSIQLLQDYRNQYLIDYKYIILYRPDLILLKDIIMDNYDDNKIYVNKFYESQGDFHFIMNLENLNNFKNLYNSIDIGNEPKTHFWIKNYIKLFMNKELIEDDIVAGEDQEVIRKIYDGTNNIINNNVLSIYSTIINN